jgi:arylsulfatase A-like enzyme
MKIQPRLPDLNCYRLVLGALLLLAPGLALSGADASRPNLVFLLADDLGYGDVGCYGQAQIATPHLDALAREGMRFTQHYAGNTVCTPSRSSLLTGRHPGHVLHRDNPRFVDSYGFLPDELTFGDLLRRAGYATGIAGKWHVGDRTDTTDMAHHHGFDFAYCVGYPYPDGGIEHWPSHVFTNGVRTSIPENSVGQRGRYMDDLYTDAALRFIEENRTRPFLLFLSFQSVHAPMDGAISPTYASRDWPAVEKTFASMLERLDENVGRVLAALRRLGIAERTVVFFSSDNGPHKEGGHDPEFFNSNGPLRGGKRDLFEGGIRVPLIVRWPGVARPGAISEHVSASWDLLPTLAELGGATVPPVVDGISFSATLRGLPQAPHEFLYWESHGEGGKQAVRLGNWKGVRLNVSKEGSPAFQLFDLASDPAEIRNVAAEHPDVVRRLTEIAVDAHVPSPMSALLPDEQSRVAPAKKTPRPERVKPAPGP